MPAGQGIDVGWVAQTVLGGIVSHFAASEAVLPDRRVIAPGDTRAIAWDQCEAVIVTCAGIGWGQAPGQGGSPRQTGNPLSATAVRHAVVTVQIVRWVPNGDGGDPPPDAELTAAGLGVLRDMGLLSQALVELCGTDGALKAAGSAMAGAVVPVGPQGFYVASEGSVEVTASKLT